jgi:hypothetical protein
MEETKEKYLRMRAAERAAAIAEITFVLDQFKKDRRNPDLWERYCLVRALSAAFSGCYRLASVEARFALTPPDLRGRDANLPTDPLFDRCDLSLLGDVLREVDAAPLREFAHLGPIQVV